MILDHKGNEIPPLPMKSEDRYRILNRLMELSYIEQFPFLADPFKVSAAKVICIERLQSDDLSRKWHTMRSHTR